MMKCLSHDSLYTTGTMELFLPDRFLLWHFEMSQIKRTGKKNRASYETMMRRQSCRMYNDDVRACVRVCVPANRWGSDGALWGEVWGGEGLDDWGSVLTRETRGERRTPRKRHSETCREMGGHEVDETRSRRSRFDSRTDAHAASLRWQPGHFTQMSTSDFNHKVSLVTQLLLNWTLWEKKIQACPKFKPKLPIGCDCGW